MRHRRWPRSTSRWWQLALLVAATSVPAPLEAQTLSGTLLATVTDTQGATIPSASARLASTALIGGPLIMSANTRGHLRFLALPPGTYALEVSAPGFRTVSMPAIRIGAGDAIERTIVLQPAGIAEAVVVRAETSRLSDRTTGVATRFGSDDLRTIPNRRASMFDFIRFAPGISPTSPSSGTTTTVSAFGSGVNTNVFLNDGTNFTCPCIGIARSEPGIDFIEEVQVQSAGASAEFGNMQGAVINVVTRQGGDRFTYDAASYWQTSDLTSQPVVLPVQGSSEGPTGYERVRYRDLSTSLGGPIVRDRLWFFGGYQYLHDFDSQPGTDPARPRRSEQDKVVGKLTWRLGPGLRLFNSFHGEWWVNPQVPTVTRPLETTLRVSASVPAVTFAHLTHTLSPDTVWDIRAGYFVYREESRPSSGDLTAVSYIDEVTRVQSGAPLNFTNVELGRTTAKGTITHYRHGPLNAEHELRAGGQFEIGGHAVGIVIPTGERFSHKSGLLVQKFARAPARVGGEFITAAAFVSDAFRFGDRTTLNAGLRFEHSRSQHQDVRGVDLFGNTTDEVIPGSDTLYTWNVWSPRLGLAHRLDSSGRTVARASYGRYHQGVLTAELDFVHPGATPTVRTVLATGQVIVEDPRQIAKIDPETRSPYTDEYSVGIDRQVGAGITLAATYVYKRGYDSIGWSDIAGVYREGVQALANGSTTPVFRLDTTVTPPSARRFLLTNQDDYSVRYQGVVFAAEKRLANGWQVFGSYTFSRASGLQPFSGTSTAGEQTSTVGPGNTWGRDPNDLINAPGRLANDRPHIFRTMASFDVPRTKILLAANLQHYSGKPWAATTLVSVPQNPEQRILLEPRGTRRLPSQTLLDVRVSRPFDLGRGVRLELLLDVLNVLNEAAAEGIATDTLTTPTEAHVASFGTPNLFVDPRRAMLGARFNFGR